METSVLRWIGRFGVACVVSYSVAHSTASAGMIIANAEATGRMVTPSNVMGIKGPGAIAMFAQVGGDVKGMGAVVKPVNGGRTFSDSDTIGPPGAMVKSIKDSMVVFRIGQGLKSAYPGLTLNSTDLGRQIDYRVLQAPDKVAAAKNAPNNTFILGNSILAELPNQSYAFSGASQQITAAANGKVDVTGKATASVQRPTPGAKDLGYAVAIVHDPVQYTLIDSTSSGEIDLFLPQDFTLQASEENSFAAALFEIGLNTTDDPDQEKLLFSFAVSIDSTTTSLANSVNVLSFDPNVLPNPRDFEESLRNSFTFDSSAHLLTVSQDIGDILLNQIVMPPGSTPVTVRFDYVSLAGVTPVPELSSLTLLALGMVSLVGYACRLTKFRGAAMS
jgi:hypothetical protein